MNIENIKKTLRISFALAFSSFKVRNQRSYLGIFWHLLDPIIFFFILMSLKSVFVKSDFELYPLYLITGLVTVNLFRRTTSQASSSFNGKIGYIQSINFPKISLVLEKMFVMFFSHIFELLIVVGFMVFFSIPLWHLFLYIPFLIVYLVFIFGISQILSIVGVYIPDIKNVWGVFTRMIWLATPIFYVVPKFHFLSVYNPMAYFVRVSRDTLMEGILFSYDLLFITVFALAALLIGTLMFRWKSRVITEAL